VRRPIWLIIAAIAPAIVAALVVVLIGLNSDDDVVTQPSTPPPTMTAEPTTSSTEPATQLPTTHTPPGPVDASTAVFPDAAGSVRFDSPVDIARAFAVDFVGFTDPIVGEFVQGDARSGEVEVRPVADGPATTVFVRQLAPGTSWWVLGAATADITVDVPGAGEEVSSPLTVQGSALAFEGNVGVEVRQDGQREPLGTGFVTGGGDVARPFTGEISFSSPASEYGAVVFLTHSAQDGRVWEAAVVRVRFG
jgi:hypothetical protein